MKEYGILSLRISNYNNLLNFATDSTSAYKVTGLEM